MYRNALLNNKIIGQNGFAFGTLNSKSSLRITQSCFLWQYFLMDYLGGEWSLRLLLTIFFSLQPVSFTHTLSLSHTLSHSHTHTHTYTHTHTHTHKQFLTPDFKVWPPLLHTHHTVAINCLTLKDISKINVIFISNAFKLAFSHSWIISQIIICLTITIVNIDRKEWNYNLTFLWRL